MEHETTQIHQFSSKFHVKHIKFQQNFSEFPEQKIFEHAILTENEKEAYSVVHNMLR